MSNHHRGEIDCVIAGRHLKFCLTLGALADIESGLGADGLAALGDRLASGRLGARDLVTILGAAARGAGEALSDAELEALPIGGDIGGLVRAVAALLRAAFLADGPPTDPL